jgi:hypothetical protein
MPQCSARVSRTALCEAAICCSILTYIAAAPSSLPAAAAVIYVGVLEAPLEQSQPFHVRVAFRFQDGRWRAMPHDVGDEAALAKLAAMFPPRVSWTIAMHGKKLGEVSGTRPSAYSRYSDVGFEDLIAPPAPPMVRDGAAAFATWMGAARYRPLLAVSPPYYHDPDRWTRFDPPAAMRLQARTAFRRAIALDLNCNGRPTRGYPDSAIQTYGEPYRSRRGDVLIAMRPDPRRNRCEEPAGTGWQSVWFHLKANKFRRIGNDLTLLDIGDYNGDGVAEILFQSHGYDRDGYLLLDLRDESKIEFSWSYH